MVGARNRPEDVERSLAALHDQDTDTALNVVLGLADGLGRAGRGLEQVRETTSPKTDALLQKLMEHAKQVAPEDDVALDRREQAIMLLGLGKAEDAMAILPPLLEPREPQRVQMAAVRALGHVIQPEVAGLLLKPWKSYSPPLRNEVIPLLLGRTIWIRPLLDAVEDGTVALGQIPPSRRSLLLKIRDPKIRAQAERLFANEVPGPRQEVIAAYRSALSRESDPERGRVVFERECMTCHRLGEKGHAVGPNLSSVQRRTAEEILVHILDPNREVAPDFVEYNVALEDGRVLSGLIDSETATSLTLKCAEDAQDAILRRNIAEITSTGKSLMPEGLESKINPQEMADLLAFLLDLQK